MQSFGFVGSVPTPLIQSIVRITKPDTWKGVYVACSGTFRTEQALIGAHPGLVVHSNDVSLFSTSLGRFALGKELDFKFTGELEFIEDLGLNSYADRVAAVVVATTYGQFAAGKGNAYKTKHRDHYQKHFVDFVERTAEKLGKMREGCAITSYYEGDWLDHVDKAIETGCGVICYPPTFKGGYEKLFQFLNENTEWEQPAYRIFDPKDLPSIVHRIHESGIPYFVYADQEVEGLEHQIEFEPKGKRRIYGYSRSGESSYRRPTNKGLAFHYRELEPAKLTKNSKIRLERSNTAKLNYLKNIYLKKSILHSGGDIQFLVYIDDMLAGGIIYTRDQMPASKVIFLMSDFATTRVARVAKLIARIAANKTIIRQAEIAFVDRYAKIRTIAFSENPVAMKYRGSWDLIRRVDNDDPNGSKFKLTYESEVRHETLDEAYAWWWSKDGKREVERARNRDQEGGPQDAPASGEERAVHGASGVQAPGGEHQDGRPAD